MDGGARGGRPRWRRGGGGGRERGGDEDADEYGEVAAVHADETPCGVEIRKTATANLPDRRSPVKERIPSLPPREPRMSSRARGADVFWRPGRGCSGPRGAGGFRPR